MDAYIIMVEYKLELQVRACSVNNPACLLVIISMTTGADELATVDMRELLV